MGIIREATPDDVPSLIRLGKIMHDESDRFKKLDYSEEKTGRIILFCINDGFAFVYQDYKGVVQGAFLGFIMESFFGNDKVASDLAFFVHPDCRGGSAAYRLAKKFISSAKESGAKQISMGITTAVNATKQRFMYEKLGLTVSGYSCHMDLKKDTPGGILG